MTNQTNPTTEEIADNIPTENLHIGTYQGREVICVRDETGGGIFYMPDSVSTDEVIEMLRTAQESGTIYRMLRHLESAEEPSLQLLADIRGISVDALKTHIALDSLRDSAKKALKHLNETENALLCMLQCLNELDPLYIEPTEKDFQEALDGMPAEIRDLITSLKVAVDAVESGNGSGQEEVQE